MMVFGCYAAREQQATGTPAPREDARGTTQQQLHLDMGIGSSGTGLSTGTNPPLELTSLKSHHSKPSGQHRG